MATIMSLPTSITLFIGMAHKGDLGRPTTIYGMAQFEQIFGSDFSYGELALQVRQFFLNGGIEAIVVRIAGDDGGTPELGDYENVFSALESTVDLFNVLILPRGFEQTDDQRQLLWGAASAFCQRRRFCPLTRPAPLRASSLALTFATHEANDERLWAQISLAEFVILKVRPIAGQSAGFPPVPKPALKPIPKRARPSGPRFR